MLWDRGAYFGALSQEERAAGGAWIIGDHPHCSDPAFPGRITDRRLLVKLWLAHPGKYTGEAYLQKNRLADNEWEYVRVMTGRLDCTAQYDCDHFTYRLEFPAEGVDLPPYAGRRWSLSNGFSEASGITVCRRDRGYQAGHGCGYELCFWDAEAPGSAGILSAPVNHVAWHRQLIMPFKGGCFVSPGLCSHDYTVPTHAYVFLSAPDRDKWTVRPGFQSRGVVIYF